MRRKRSRWNKKLKRWHDRHSKKLARYKKKKSCSYIPKGYKPPRVSFKTTPSMQVIVPEDFSLVNNTEETMRFFVAFSKEIEQAQRYTQFFIDSSQVRTVTVDALIYLLAILENNQKITIKKQYTYYGNFPNHDEAKKVYQESGFTKYVRAKNKILPTNTEKKRIIRGGQNDPNVAAQFCRFVIEKLGKRREETTSLFIILIELMSNVFHHAYERNSVKCWYIYAEHIDDYIRFVFVDTGVGIAKTVRKNFKEKVRALFGLNIGDGDLLRSTFSGDFRTQTKEGYRGNGLSTVRERVYTGPFKQFEAISGSGKCLISADDKKHGYMVSYNYDNAIHGTLYTFDIY